MNTATLGKPTSKSVSRGALKAATAYLSKVDEDFCGICNNCLNMREELAEIIDRETHFYALVEALEATLQHGCTCYSVEHSYSCHLPKVMEALQLAREGK
jgi:hypothetical protein